ncbi:MAG: DUF1566 domain-containing protein [Acidobacteria bacterium]|nr:MAG: DUF1566 domain-containing protein [Acidobacteriota bacterium]
MMWTIRDNGGDIDWHGAKAYCENLGLAGYGDWLLPDIDSLAALYDESRSFDCFQWEGKTYQCHVSAPILLTGPNAWSSSMRGSSCAWGFNFGYGRRLDFHLGTARYGRVLCVRRSGS